MNSDVFIKKVLLSDSRCALIKSKFNEPENRVEIKIFVKENCEIFSGECSLDSLRKKKQDIDVDYDTIKGTLTSAEVQESISYELDDRKFSVVAREKGDSESISEIYLRVEIKKVCHDNAITLALDMSEEMLMMGELKSIANQYKSDLKDIQQTFDKLVAEKIEKESILLSKFHALLNSKKKQISKLERQLAMKSHSNTTKFNLSSDLELSDISLEGRSLRSGLLSIQSSQEVEIDPKPTTSKTPIKTSPVKKVATPKARTPKSAARARKSPRGTPKKANSFQPSRLFKFDPLTSDDSLDELKVPLSQSKTLPLQPVKPPKILSSENLLDGFTHKITIKRKSDEKSRSSAELFTARSRLDSTSSESSRSRHQKSETPDFVQPAQVIDDLPRRASKRKQPSAVENFSQNSDEDIFVMELDEKPLSQKSDDDVVLSSQPHESPSIFKSFSKRQTNKSTNQASKKPKKSVFSADTEDIFGDISI